MAASWRKAQADYAALKAERDALKAELAEAHATMRGVAAIIRAAKITTANEIEALIRQRDIERAKRAERDPNRPLN